MSVWSIKTKLNFEIVNSFLKLDLSRKSYRHVKTKAKAGSLILFTGTDPGKRIVGHIGIITNTLNGEVEFIHSSSGKAKGVTISDLSGYYETRLVKIIRIFPTAANEVAV